jgi:hypothetical protein
MNRNQKLAPQPARSPGPAVLLAALALALAGAACARGAEPPTNGPAPAAPVATSEAPARQTNAFQAFEIIAERNIFDPSRTRRTRPGERGPTPPAPKVDVIALTGTMIYAQGDFAFFDSTATEFRKVAKSGDAVAGYTVKDIQQDHVALEQGTNTFQLKVGEQLRRENGGDWEVTSGPALNASINESDGAPRDAARSNTESADPGPNSTTAAASPEGPSDALKRLLERRRKEQTP